MSYQEKRTIVSIISGLLIFGIYSAYIYSTYPEQFHGPEVDFKFWGKAFLILLPVTIVARIIIFIIFGIVNKVAWNEDGPCFEDERDKLIELKATRNGYYVFMLGFMLAMGSLLMDWPPYSMFLVFAFSGVIAELVSGFSSLHFYRRGI